MEYNLEERTKNYSRSVLKFFKHTQLNLLNENIVKQVLRSVTSIGANYCEANGAVSRPDFKQKLYICKKEAKETMYWFDLLEDVINEKQKNDLAVIKVETRQLMLIFSKITNSLKD